MPLLHTRSTTPIVWHIDGCNAGAYVPRHILDGDQHGILSSIAVTAIASRNKR